ncbi:Diacylglycerol O-acyltransferase 2 [Phytophthora cinnamomi]|uniref:Diacylglycerol O-acyltransferase 2 n=1 Tax=Phytophthora cinnamomi TaxID=4785 RepID=UPI0035594031|nr:Diacylglycerol O-acyltransferase 2 [Phytophthora cinnamomi]
MSTAAGGLKNAACGRTPAWPDNNARPELRTLRGRVLRHLQLWVLYGLWVVGMGSIVVMWAVSLFSIARWVWTAVMNTDAAPLPYAVRIFLSAVAVHESYYCLTPASLHQWPFMRRVMRFMFLHYPYFRLNVTVFEEREEAERKLREASHATGEELLDLNAAASKAIEENDSSPFVQSNDRSLFAFHPHGVLSNGFAINGAHHMTFERAECRWLVAENLFWFPVLREVLNWMDFSSVARATFQRIMPTGQNVSLIPGGFEEATLYRRGKHRVYIKKRFGFIKMALQYGYKVHPVYTFGEEYAYHAFPSLLQLRLKLNEYKLPGVVFFGRLNCCYLPRTDVDLITVVGKPLVLPHIENPTREDVKKYHDRYIEALQGLFDRYKGVYAVDPCATLEIY